ncbi:DUF4293 family protein [Leptobacterium flavescens]|uniref:DUF4293 family protein n=1 Tax=Leptobacterium flavescens TaxID=472055 RepID=A0A6P0UX60_9FLAO|nr:DUF4293 domain-containing protein [Leptobacterium flavescens]NER15313.1 DUF4293 family protein [Leptobacterium flavescens]
MLQRIQSIYLLLVVLISGGLPFLLSLWVNNIGEDVFAKDNILFLVIFIGSAVLAGFTIFLFRNRKLQFVLNRLNMILNLTLLGVFVVRSLNISGESAISEKGIGMLLPIISIVFLVLANKAIKKDEDLVKSVDRLR